MPNTLVPSCDVCAAPPVSPFLHKFDLGYVRCPQCGHVYACPRLADATEYNDEIYADRIQEYVRKQYGKRHQQDYATKLKRFESYRRTGRLLEIGSNVGGFLKVARDLGWEGIGIEPAAVAARYAIDQQGLDVRIGTLDNLTLPANSFDVVFGNAVLEHVANPLSMLRQIASLLRPGGVVYQDTVNIDSYTFERLGTRWKLVDPREHLSLFTPATLRMLMQRAGLKTIKMTSHGARLRANDEARAQGLAALIEAVQKAPLSFLSRRRLKGDSIDILAMRPGV